ncbi:fibropellin-1-like [Aplysia californica]|uniref:Fibropellin-1-like n=1 Tax=Aplysia californica TaxID=6500 RepID=A0ABM1VQX7_APLCA|nr:fibropellin-1-like [Aplysia californica]
MVCPNWQHNSWLVLAALLLSARGQTGTDPCAPVQCQNGGSCQISPDNVAFCACATGFTGSLCEVAVVDECSLPNGHRCQNNARCVDELSGYKCVCLSGWEGDFCETVSFYPSLNTGFLWML